MSALFGNYGKRRAQIVKGQGTVVEDSTGKQYLDFTSGIAVASLGHAHPAIVQALQEQSEKLWHISNLFDIPGQETVAEKLIAHTHFAHAFFCNSGAEANEAAIKLARKHTGKNHIITFEKSFHGRTFGAMSATGQGKIHNGFGPLVEKFTILPFNDAAALEATIDDSVAAVMLEMIQGEGGVNCVSLEFANAIAKACDDKGILLIIDEVQTGIGRTGTRYAFEQTVLKPHIVTLAKGLGGGFPVGAMLGTAELYSTFSPGTHGTTFGGNPLAMNVAQAVLSHVFEPAFLQQVQDQSAYFVAQLKAHLPSNYIIQGQGLMLGISCGETEVAAYITAAEEKGLLLVGAGPNVIRLLPPLTVTKEEIDEAVAILKTILY
ncbi:acetylornithine transaminase [Lysinibacillus sp. FSL R7-0073]|uniref:Acetylornithine aminotransferase n=1 Tax=Lysinibacillus fusiformis TaxID=28031 RepID=A0A1E4RAI2_9BACI|nr:MULTISPECIES: acetylornithine transaminase [Lysinibacillus]MBD8522515.1 acetylornithine transaminase [Lysinibacillus fusiformis]MED4888543.1 acetylornithine transaminase [Lysinibacillus fusiformis]ODV57485.1 acetylornithine aminotransferase [Lysinibacillus fusiformis]